MSNAPTPRTPTVSGAATTGLLPPTARFTLDNEPVDIAEFIAVNLHVLESEDIDRIAALKVGEEIHYGGGAAALFVLRREADACWLCGMPTRRVQNGRPLCAECNDADGRA